MDSNCVYLVGVITYFYFLLQDTCRRAAILSNKVMKHGFIPEMETIIDKDSKVSHEKIASTVRRCKMCEL
jgi:hypothetical protein